jgi:putative PIN family toxin of toxin-antitoxin system
MPAGTARALVLDTNVVLDLLVFQDPACAPLLNALKNTRLRWIATPAMRDELARVLAYPQIAARLGRPPHRANLADAATEVLQRFDAMTQVVTAACKAPVTCRDRDDQMFIDLAVAHRAILLSKDGAVLCMKKRLLAHSVIALGAISSVSFWSP